MTGTAQLPFAALAPAATHARQLGLAAASWIVAANIWTGGPLFAYWVGSHLERSGSSSMASIVAVVIVLAVVSYGLIAVLGQLEIAHARVTGAETTDRLHLSWLHGTGRRRSTQRDARPQPRPRRGRCNVATATPGEPLVLLDGTNGAARPWAAVSPQLAFGFDVLAGVLPRDGTIDGTLRAMDGAGWETVHIVARRCDERAAVELARRGRARSLLILDSDPTHDAPDVVAAEIVESIAFRPAS
jgi:hypothetical protein